MRKSTLLPTLLLFITNCYAGLHVINASVGIVPGNERTQTDSVDYGSCEMVPSGSPCFFGLYSFWITQVFFGTLNFTGGTCAGDGSDDGYQNLYDVDSGTVMLDSSYIFSVSRSGSSGGGYFSAWVDWNNDGDFADSSELLFTVSGAVGSTTRTFNVTVPANAVVGEHRLRVRSDGSDPGGNPNPCATTGPYGDTKDFKLNIMLPPPLMVDETVNNPLFSISPNPANDKLNIYCLNPSKEIKKIYIYNIFGEIVLTETTDVLKQMPLNIRGLTPGIYFVRLSAEQDQQVLKFVKRE